MSIAWRRWVQSSSWLLPRQRCWPLALGERRRDCRRLSDRWCAPITSSRDDRFSSTGRPRRHKLDNWVGSLHLSTERSSSQQPQQQPRTKVSVGRLVFIPPLSPQILSLSIPVETKAKWSGSPPFPENKSVNLASNAQQRSEAVWWRLLSAVHLCWRKFISNSRNTGASP